MSEGEEWRERRRDRGMERERENWKERQRGGERETDREGGGERERDGGGQTHLSVAPEVWMVQFGVGELQQSRCDHSSFHSGVDVPDRTVVLTLRSVRRPVGK